MGDIIRSHDLVLLSYAQSLLKAEGIGSFMADLNLAVAEGSIGAFRPRLLVTDEDEARARRILREAGLGDELRPDG